MELFDDIEASPKGNYTKEKFTCDLTCMINTNKSRSYKLTKINVYPKEKWFRDDANRLIVGNYNFKIKKWWQRITVSVLKNVDFEIVESSIKKYWFEVHPDHPHYKHLDHPAHDVDDPRGDD